MPSKDDEQAAISGRRRRLAMLIPHMLTTMRILCTLALPFLPLPSVAFIIVYVLAGLSDVLDGMLARRWHVASSFGASYDSIADTVFALVCIWLFLSYLLWPVWLIAAFACICVIKSLTAIIGWRKYRLTPFVHSTLNKITGILVFFTPMLIIAASLITAAEHITNGPRTLILVGLCLFAAAAAVDELVITLLSPSFDANRRSSLHIRRSV